MGSGSAASWGSCHPAALCVPLSAGQARCLNRPMGLRMHTPAAAQVADLVDELASWQRDGLPVQLHPGDVGWYAMRGMEAAAQGLRAWADRESIYAIGLLDGPNLIRMALHPDFVDIQPLAEQIHADLSSAENQIFPAESASIEARGATALGKILQAHGWMPGEAWTPLRRALDAPVRLPELAFRRIDASLAGQWMEVHLNAFRGSDFTQEDLARALQRWHTMASTPIYEQGQCLTAYDGEMNPLAVAGVWSAGSGRPGLLEPIAVHPAFRGQGFGTAISLAAAAELRSMGASSALVCTPSENRAAVATYLAAGFVADTEDRDWHRGEEEPVES